jgi:hypothetical protein
MDGDAVGGRWGRAGSRGQDSGFGIQEERMKTICFPPSAYCRLPTVFREGGKSNFKKRTSDAGMSMKTKDRCGKGGAKAGMFVKIKVVMR